MTSWTEPAARLLGDRTAAALSSAFGVRTVGDLLLHLPRRYAERGTLSDLRWLRPDDHVTVLARISDVRTRPMQRKRGSMLVATVTDGTSSLTLTFFNQAWRERDLKVGRTGLFSGKVGLFRGARQLSHPDYLILDADDPSAALEAVDAFAAAVLPIYPATAALPSWRIAKCVGILLDAVAATGLDDPVPADLLAERGLPDLATAVRLVHRPEAIDEPPLGRRRLAYDEALVLQSVLAARRGELAARPAVPRTGRVGGLADRLRGRLPWPLTGGQEQVLAEITADLGRAQPMHRLLQGEVGSGKTVVALLAMLGVVDSGGQAALLAPTEVLAQQHEAGIRALLGPLGERGRLGGDEDATAVVLLTGSMTAAQRRSRLLQVAAGEAGLVIGTHALLTEQVSFADLGLVVVDEQHRFGVEQRDALRSKGDSPHLLVMTATPIPRTVAMTVFGDLDVSTLAELPSGRAEMTTHVVDAVARPAHLARVWEKIAEEAAAGRQSYIVCPRIGADDPDLPADGDGLGAPDDGDEGAAAPRPPATAVLELAERLRSGPLRDLRLGVLHGRLPGEEKDRVMTGFAAGELDVLIATTVVEVGVDVPNASVMAVMDADRFGVSQLHQLRGRVGRGEHPGLCLLVTAAPPPAAADRLAAVAATTDGFALAEVDLAARREGDVLGAAQSGRRSSLRVLSVVGDGELIGQARDDAARLVAADPALAGHPGLAAAVARLVAAEQAEYLEKS